MKTFGRLCKVVTTTFEGFVTSVENHEAIADAAIREAKEASIRARHRLKKVVEDGTILKNRLDVLREEERNWHERAKRLARDDETKALDCLRRRERSRQARERCEREEAEHRSIEARLREELREIEARVAQMKGRRNILSMRESNASARGAIEGGDSVSSGEIAELFDRWETKIEMLEVHTSSPPEDPIEDEFEREEEEARLKDILASLRE